MSRGGRGGRGRGGFGRGRGGFAGSMPPMGLTFADIQSLSREEDALYPVRFSNSCKALKNLMSYYLKAPGPASRAH